MVNVSEIEQLREALLNQGHALDCERELRLESERMLDGLRALDLNQDTESVLGELIATSRTVIPFQDAFILIRVDGGCLRPIVATAPLYDNSLWEPKAIFGRALHGQPLALFDIEEAEEWRAQPPPLRNRARSALLIPLHPAGQSRSCRRRCVRHE